MSLYLEEEGEITLPFETKEVADLVVEAALEYEGCPYEAEINLLLTCLLYTSLYRIRSRLVTQMQSIL